MAATRLPSQQQAGGTPSPPQRGGDPNPPPGRSSTEFQFEEDQADDIVRVVGWHRKDFSLCVISFDQREHSAVRDSIGSPFPRLSTPTHLGQLERLPLELIQDVLLCLDIRSLWRFRQLNLESRQMVNSLVAYRLVTSYALDVFCALLRTGLAAHVSLADLFLALCTKTCALCGEFAGFIFLLPWTRCCHACLRTSEQTRVQRWYHSEDVSSLLLSFNALPGRYGMLGDFIVRKSFPLASVWQVRENYGLHPPGKTGRTQLEETFTYLGACSLPWYDKRTGRLEHGISCAACQLAKDNSRSSKKTTTDWVLDAGGEKMFEQKEFLNHFRWCAGAQLRWSVSDEGRNRSCAMPRLGT
ncbi:hypothetical protein B0H66DRAFT_580271 [Apodospora peruviana]|uniref:F-box domain-containing protein n=1 Tax=Apodospora peruviana TaxID=516989 RepID=A0AAE0MGA7_9PEZI|nr:hypothetical protein B0H66DRAFT_580271 [Apodospora peruviana]